MTLSAAGVLADASVVDPEQYLNSSLKSLLVVCMVTALAAILVRLIPGNVPQVVLLLAGGVIVGPQVLGWAATSPIQLFSEVGLGFLFLLTGLEIDPKSIRTHSGHLAVAAWMVSLVLAVAVVSGLSAADLVDDPIPIAIALTTTALGTLMPMLRDNGMLGGRLGNAVMVNGTVGEIAPILAIAVLLGAYESWVEVAAIGVVVLLALLLVRLPRWLGHTRFADAFRSGLGGTSQSALRFTVLILVALLLITDEFGLDAVLGAFIAGMVLRHWISDDDEHALEEKLDVIGYGFFIPIFFVTSGMALDINSIAENPWRLVIFTGLLLVVRGLPTFFIYRRALPVTRRVQLMLFTGTSLPLLVALAQIGLSEGHMLPENAAALVGAGALSVALFPFLAFLLEGRAKTADINFVAQPDDAAVLADELPGPSA